MNNLSTAYADLNQSFYLINIENKNLTEQIRGLNKENSLLLSILNKTIVDGENDDLKIYPKRIIYEIGDAVTFVIRGNVSFNDLYIIIKDPNSSIVWRSDNLTWEEINGEWVVPFNHQTSANNPMILPDNIVNGIWTWTLYKDNEQITEGIFKVTGIRNDSSITSNTH